MTHPLDLIFEGVWEREHAARVARLKVLFAEAKSEGRDVNMGEYIKALAMPYLYGDDPLDVSREPLHITHHGGRGSG